MVVSFIERYKDPPQQVIDDSTKEVDEVVRCVLFKRGNVDL